MKLDPDALDRQDGLKRRQNAARETGENYTRVLLVIGPIASVYLWPWFWKDWYFISGPLVLLNILLFAWLPDKVGMWLVSRVK